MERTFPPVAIVTGAGRGLGAVIARTLAARGVRLVAGGREKDALRRVRDELAIHGTDIVVVAGDVTESSTRARLVDAARALGGLDVLVNNASELGGIGPLATFDARRLPRVFDVNVIASLALTQRAIPLLALRRGLIVDVTSDAAHGAYPGWGPYGASKAALELLTRTLAVELQDQGISATLVDPGDMRTRMHQEAYPGEDISDRPLPEVTAPFWAWLFAQRPQDVNGQRFAAQQEDAPWQPQASSI